ncbi:DEAD/DEAH box helicase, putative, partial [Entamoeba invadens IP1]
FLGADASIKKKFPTYDLPLLKPLEDMGVTDADVKDSISRLDELKKRWEEVQWTDEMQKEFNMYVEREMMKEEISVLESTVNKSKDVILKDELRGMRRVLKRLGYVSEDDIIQVKGRVASEISAGNEIMITELLFSGAFTQLNAAQSVALLSMFVVDAKQNKDDTPQIPKGLIDAYEAVISTGKRLVTVMNECRLDIKLEDYIQQFNPLMMDIVMKWCSGVTFAQLVRESDKVMYEGSIIRSMRMLEELLEQMVSISRYMGTPDLNNKFAEGITLIKRDIIFAASLYID